jgi:phosphomannomutase/phosphoglucomutase
LEKLVEARIAKFPCSGEINFKVADAKASIEKVMAHFAKSSPRLDYTDGVSAEFDEWRFNLRSSNTEPLLRLNIETKGDVVLLHERVAELTSLIGTPDHSH